MKPYFSIPYMAVEKKQEQEVIQLHLSKSEKSRVIMKRYCYIIISIFMTLASCWSGYKIKNDGVYYKDRNEASGINKIVTDADPKTFIIIKDTLGHFSGYGKDNDHVYMGPKKVIGADANTFSLLRFGYSIDRYRAYYTSDSIESSTSSGFSILSKFYSSDDKDVYYENKPLHVCDVKKFVFLNDDFFSRWATDNCHYYFNNFKIPSDDYKNIHIFMKSGGIAKDNDWVYIKDRKLNYNQNGEIIIDTIDAATFTEENYRFKDKFGCIKPLSGRFDCDK